MTALAVQASASRPPRPPTERQLEVLGFVRDFIAREGMSPTVREIAAGIQVASTYTVIGHLRMLEAKGLLRSTPGTARSWRPVETETPSRPGSHWLDAPLLEHAGADLHDQAQRDRLIDAILDAVPLELLVATIEGSTAAVLRTRRDIARIPDVAAEVGRNAAQSVILMLEVRDVEPATDGGDA